MKAKNSSITFSVLENVVTITICRQKQRNSLDDQAVADLAGTLVKTVAPSPMTPTSPRAIIITGDGDHSFCAGYDVSSIDPTSGIEPRFPDSRFAAVTDAVEQCPCPVIAAVNGDAYGGGLDLALTCDLAFAVPSARFAMTPCKLGLVYERRGIARMLAKLGPHLTRKLLYTGEPITAKEMLTAGALTAVVEPHHLMSQTMALATRIASLAPLAVAGTRRLIQSVERWGPTDQDPAATLRVRTEALESSDLREGLAAFDQKRDPVFRGR